MPSEQTLVRIRIREPQRFRRWWRMTRTSSELPIAQATRSAPWLALPLLLGALVSLTVGLLEREQAIAPGTYPGGYFQLFFSDWLQPKIWFATVALALAGTQLFTTACIFGKLQ